MASSIFTSGPLEVDSPKVTYTEEHITAEYDYKTTAVTLDAGKVVAKPLSETYTLRTKRKVPKTGVLFVGWGGNNGTTVTASLLAHQKKVTWRTARGEHTPDFLGSLTQASTVRLGNAAGRDVYAPMTSLLPMVDPTQLVVGGWDISSMNMGDAMRRAGVLDYDLQRQLYDDLTALKPMPSVYFPDFIAANQSERADNVLTGTKQEQMERLRADIRGFKAAHELDTVLVLWTANTERFCTVSKGVNTTADELLASVAAGHAEVAPSTLFAVASILEGCTFINGSPQNTLVPGAIELAAKHGVFIAGDDFKSGQTKMKSVLVDFLVSAGIKPVSIVSYNHLGNNDGKNLSAPQQFRSKEISKSNVVDDMVASNGIMFKPGEKPDHCVVIKYVPYVGDSKRALDEYTAEIFMGGLNTISMHNTCEDSLLASPLILDLIVLGELCERIQLKKEGDAEFHGFHSVLSLLSFLLKAPMVAPGTPVVNALFKQREAIVNILRACIGLDPENHMLLEHRIHTAGTLAPGGVALDTTGGYSLTGGAPVLGGGAAAGAGADSCGKALEAAGNGAAAAEAKTA